MAVLSTGQSFASGDQVTAQKLIDIVGQAYFTSAADTTDNSTLTLGSSKLKVKDAGITATQLANDSVITDRILDGAVTAAKLDPAAVSVLMPTGSIMSFAGASAPTGYLLCDGAAIARQAGGSDTALFTLLGITYGPGDGSSTYNIPDLRGRVIAGQDDMGGASANRLTGLTGGVDGDVLGGSGGAETHTLATSELPAHDHDVDTAVKSNNTNGVAGNYPTGTNLSSPSAVQLGANTNSIKNTGGGGAHNNVQPTFILNYIIKT